MYWGEPEHCSRVLSPSWKSFGAPRDWPSHDRTFRGRDFDALHLSLCGPIADAEAREQAHVQRAIHSSITGLVAAWESAAAWCACHTCWRPSSSAEKFTTRERGCRPQARRCLPDVDRTRTDPSHERACCMRAELGRIESRRQSSVRGYTNDKQGSAAENNAI